jgi:cadmium resistance protein CadD (predicted permease)
MKINEHPYLMLGIFFSALTICLSFLYLLNYVNGETMAIFLGVTQLFLGFNQINMAHKKDSKGINKGNKKVGIFCVIVGIVIIINVIIKMML